MELLSHSPQETQNFATEIAQKALAQSATSGALVIALEGELGAGKTTFVQGFMQSLGVTEAVKSPTFLLMKKYTIGEKHFYHLDCYRINDAKDLEPLEVPQLLTDSKNILLIEWAERVALIIPSDAWHIHIDHVDDTTRKMTIKP